MEFLFHGATDFDEPGLFVSFEEGAEDLVENFRCMGFDLSRLVQEKRLKISYVELAREQIVETGEFTLDALLIRLRAAVAEVGAKRVVLDTMGNLFSAVSNTSTLRKEVSRLLRWFKDEGLTCVLTGERGTETLTKYGFEDYVSDCVILLDHRVQENISKRRLRVIKYRGSTHGKDEYPFLIGARGFSVFPITSSALDHTVNDRRVSTGVAALDAVFEGKGYFRGSTVLISGKAGTGKSTLAAAFAAAACERGERAVYLAFEESPAQLERNMRSVGIELGRWREEGLLDIQALRPTSLGLEEHLIGIMNFIEEFQPDCVIMDPVSNFLAVGAVSEVKSMLTRVLDHLKSRGLTQVLTALTPGSGQDNETEANVSSLVDTWLALEQEPVGHTHRRGLYIIKSRGMDHSHDTHELVMSSDGLSLRNLQHQEEPRS